MENALRNTSASDSSSTEDKLPDFKIHDEWLNEEFTDENGKAFTSESRMDADNTGEMSEERIIFENPYSNKDVNQNDEWNRRQIVSDLMESDDNDANEGFNEKKNTSDSTNISDLSNSPYIYDPNYLYYTY